MPHTTQQPGEARCGRSAGAGRNGCAASLARLYGDAGGVIAVYVCIAVTVATPTCAAPTAPVSNLTDMSAWSNTDRRAFVCSRIVRENRPFVMSTPTLAAASSNSA